MLRHWFRISPQAHLAEFSVDEIPHPRQAMVEHLRGSASATNLPGPNQFMSNDGGGQRISKFMCEDSQMLDFLLRSLLIPLLLVFGDGLRGGYVENCVKQLEIPRLNTDACCASKVHYRLPDCAISVDNLRHGKTEP